jgi:V/A-type H+-transporting ATPase subunit C
MIFDPSNIAFWLLIIAVITLAVAIIARPFSTYAKFVYPKAKFEAIGNPFLQEKNLTSVIDNKNLSDFKDSLNASKDYKISGETTLEIQQSLDDNFIKTIDMMRKDSSKKMNEFYSTYIQKMDLYLIKKELKNKLTDNAVSEESINNTLFSSSKKFLSDLSEAEKDQISGVIKNYGFGNELISLINQDNVDFLVLDSLIDKFMINSFKEARVPYKCENGKKRFIKTTIDIINIKNVLRCKQIGYDKETCMKIFLGEGQEIAKWKYEEFSGVDEVSQVISGLEGTSYYNVLKDSIEDYNKGKSVQVLENALDSLFLKLVKDLSIQNYPTIGPTIRFLISKEFEIKNLKIIAKGIGEGFSSEFIKPLLTREMGL